MEAPFFIAAGVFAYTLALFPGCAILVDMELIFLSARLVYWLFIAPIWWAATYLASYFYPMEGEAGQFTLSLVFSLMIGAAVVALLYYTL